MIQVVRSARSKSEEIQPNLAALPNARNNIWGYLILASLGLYGVPTYTCQMSTYFDQVRKGPKQVYQREGRKTDMEQRDCPPSLPA